ncbi:MAG TPA: hypothetical protein VNM43_01700, partial [Dehalococcoidia bacterium]|nr:hypothetical protein [Dehalococcoidia bacterium]
MKALSPSKILAASSIATLLVGAHALGLPLAKGQAAGPHIDLFFMSALGAGNPLRFCTGLYDPPVHSVHRAIDVFGDDTTSLCLGDKSAYTYLRSWGFGGSSSHHTMTGFPSGDPNPSGCDVVRIGMIDAVGGLHGELVWMHTSRTRSAPMEMYAGPSP